MACRYWRCRSFSSAHPGIVGNPSLRWLSHQVSLKYDIYKSGEWSAVFRLVTMDDVAHRQVTSVLLTWCLHPQHLAPIGEALDPIADRLTSLVLGVAIERPIGCF